MAHLVKATEDHARALAPILRPADRAEIEALTRRDPLEILLRHAAKPNAWAMFSDAGELAGMCGVAPIYPPIPDSPRQIEHGPTKIGLVWMMGSDVLDKHPVEFLRASLEWVEAQHERYETLHNVVDARNEKHIAWLRWLGFQVSTSSMPMGSGDLPFYPFKRTARTQ